MGKTKTTEKTVAPAATEGSAEAAVKVSAAAKRGKRIERGRVYIKASYNNTMISVADERGNVVMWATAGSTGFSGPKKATPFAASKIIAILSEKMKVLGMSTIDIYVRGVGSGRDSAVRSLVNQGFAVNIIKDVTGIPHNGPRPPKVRRV